MGIIDTAKMLRKAQQAKAAMSKIVVAGRSKSGLTAILLNGINEIVEIHFEDELLQDVDGATLGREVIEAFNDARKQLETEMASSMDMSSIRDMFGG
jgi:DNA-binding protein YbaB